MSTPPVPTSTPRLGGRRRTLRVAVVGMVLFLGLSAAGCTSVPDEVDDAARSWNLPLNPDRTDPADLEVGDCVEEPSGEEIMALRVLDCAEEHGAELVEHVTVADDDGRFPRDSSPVWIDAEDECIAALEEYVGEDYWESDWDFALLTPSLELWDAGGHSAQCLAVHVNAYTWSGSPRTGEVELLEMVPDQMLEPQDWREPGVEEPGTEA